MPTIPRTVQAVAFMLLSMASLSCMNIAVRLLAPDMHSTQMVLLRNIFSLVIIVMWSALLARGVPHFHTLRIKSHFWRAAVGALAMQMWFYAVTIMPLNLVTALSFTTPIFAAVFAIVFLREQAGIRRWGAILAGFIGTLIILRPDMGMVHPAAGIVLLASCLMATSGTLVKSLTRTEPPETIVFYMALFMIPWSIPPAFFQWRPILPHHWELLFIIALLSTSAHLLMARAFMRADMMVLLPFDFTRLIFTATLTYFFFGETLDAHTVTGALVIVMSAVYIAHRERIRGSWTVGRAPGK